MPLLLFLSLWVAPVPRLPLPWGLAARCRRTHAAGPSGTGSGAPGRAIRAEAASGTAAPASRAAADRARACRRRLRHGFWSTRAERPMPQGPSAWVLTPLGRESHAGGASGMDRRPAGGATHRVPDQRDGATDGTAGKPGRRAEVGQKCPTNGTRPTGRRWDTAAPTGPAAARGPPRRAPPPARGRGRPRPRARRCGPARA